MPDSAQCVKQLSPLKEYQHYSTQKPLYPPASSGLSSHTADLPSLADGSVVQGIVLLRVYVRTMLHCHVGAPGCHVRKIRKLKRKPPSVYFSFFFREGTFNSFAGLAYWHDC